MSVQRPVGNNRQQILVLPKIYLVRLDILLFGSPLFASVPFDWELVEQCLPDTDEEDLEDIRDGYLLKFNLLQLTSQHTYRIHPLVKEFLQAKLAQLESALQLKQAFTRVMAAIST